MKISVFIERQNKRLSVNVDKMTTIDELLKKLKVNPVAVVTTVNNEVVTEGYKIKGNEKIEIHSVVSGG